MNDDDDVMPPEVEIEMALRRDKLRLADRTAPLVRLLRSGDAIPHETRELLADLLDPKGGGEFVVEIKRRRRGRVPPIFSKNDTIDALVAESPVEKIAAAKGVSTDSVRRYVRRAKQKPSN